MKHTHAVIKMAIFKTKGKLNNKLMVNAEMPKIVLINMEVLYIRSSSDVVSSPSIRNTVFKYLLNCIITCNVYIGTRIVYFNLKKNKLIVDIK
jgi:hypothetical protein